MRWQGRRQSDRIDTADPSKTHQVDPEPYLGGRTRMPFEVPLDDSPMVKQRRMQHINKSAYAKGGFVEDFARGYNTGESYWGGDDDTESKRKKREDLFPDEPGGLYRKGGMVKGKRC